MGDLKRTYTLELTDYQAAMLYDEIATHAQRLEWMAEELQVISSVLGTRPDPTRSDRGTERSIEEQIADAVSNPNMTPETQAAVESMMRQTYDALVQQAQRDAGQVGRTGSTDG